MVDLYVGIFEPCHKKKGLEGLRPVMTQIGMYSHRGRLES